MLENPGSEVVRLAILGCGAVTERLHLPAAGEVAGLEVVALVDRDLERARALARSAPGARATTDTDFGKEEVDAVLVALPNHLHAPVSRDFLERGVAVLVEKPMALTAAEARTMIEAARTCGSVLQVAQMKRFAKGARLVKEVLDEGLLGAPLEVSIEWGVEFGWPLASGAGMLPEEAGGGVLVDFGSHLLDLLCWWFGTPETVAYADDARGGVEADCELALEMNGPHGRVPAEARFSRLRTLGNTARIRGERLTLEWEHETPDAVRLWPTDWKGAAPPWYGWETDGPQAFHDLFVEQLRAFASAVAEGGPSPVPGESVLPGIELIERCYQVRRRLEEPWDRPVKLSAGAAAGA